MTTSATPSTGSDAPSSTTGNPDSTPYESARTFVALVWRQVGQPGNRSALRSGVGRTGRRPVQGDRRDPLERMHRAIAHYVPAGLTHQEAEAHYAIASIIAALPRTTAATEADEPAEEPADSTATAPDKEPTATAAATAESSSGSAAEAAPTPGATAAAPTPSAGSTRTPARPPRARNLGQSLAEAVAAGRITTTYAENRLALLVRQSAAGLHRYLPATVLRLASERGAVDFAQLLLDLRWWHRHHTEISRRWQQSYYRAVFAATARQAEADDQAEQEQAADNATTG
ncbi:type I-E CRISPR-associated protein Cse2/CasB [Streptomyces sp. NPDC088923]|uniref:type I-E CRISPR-associated protein Cse2/CasB n=1 Tax=Streptomyces sp. NPDC088923 TaxID=3365913 RepID=UPI0038062A2F